jgi:hypothetical protein
MMCFSGPFSLGAFRKVLKESGDGMYIPFTFLGGADQVGTPTYAKRDPDFLRAAGRDR